MRKLHDRYFKQAKREGHLARSYYKLEELDRRFRIFRKGARVLDLGAAPGSWLEYILSIIGDEGIACAADIQPIHRKFKGRVTFRLSDIRDLPADAFAGVETHLRIRKNENDAQIEFESTRDLARPTVCAYWVPAGTAEPTAASGVYLGPVWGPGVQRYDLPGDAPRQGGTILLYSLVDAETVAQTAIAPL